MGPLARVRLTASSARKPPRLDPPRPSQVWNLTARVRTGDALPPCKTLLPPMGSGEVVTAAHSQPLGAFGRAALARYSASPSASAVDYAVVSTEWLRMEPYTTALTLVVAYASGHVYCLNFAAVEDPTWIDDHHAILVPHGGGGAGGREGREAGADKLTSMSVADIPDAPAVVLVGYADGHIDVYDIVESGLSTPHGQPQPAFRLPSKKGPEPGHNQAVLDILPGPGGVFLTVGADSKLHLWMLTPHNQTAASHVQTLH